MKHFFKIKLIQLSLLLMILGCSRKENLDVESKINTVDNVEAIRFATEFNNNASFSRENSENYVEIFTTFLSNLSITNLDDKITILPAVTTDANAYSRVMLLEINGKLRRLYTICIQRIILQLNIFTVTC